MGRGRLGWVLAGLLLAAVQPAHAQGKLVVSIWGGNWRDGANDVIGKEFTKRTGIRVDFVTGGTMDRLTKSKLAKGHPESDLTITTSHVGQLYVNDDLFEKLDLGKIPNLKDAVPVAQRSPYHIGLYAYVYTPAFRTDLMPKGYEITSWQDLWKPELKNKLGLPDFDPTHIMFVAAKLSGADPTDWKKGIPLLEKLKPNIKTFYQSDATSQDLMKTGETPVQVLLTINAYHQISQGIPVKIEIPKEGGVVGIDAIGINKGSKMVDAAHQFINLALDAEIQAKLCETYKCSPVNTKAKLDKDLASLPGIFSSWKDWQDKAILIPDEARAKEFPEMKSWFTENMTR